MPPFVDAIHRVPHQKLRRGFHLGILLAGLSLSPVWAKTIPIPTATPGVDAGLRSELATQVETNLVHHILGVWFPRSIDREHGGYHENFAEDWTRLRDNQKSLVCQSRLIWTSAQAARRYPARREEFAGYARHGFEFLSHHLWDRQDGGFFWGVDEHGQPTTPRGTEKHVYGIGFGIYASVAHFQATRDPAALKLAQAGFRWLEKHAHDRRHLGYFEVLTRAGQPILTAPANAPKSRDAIGTPYGYKSMNSHIHLLETLTALYEVWPDRLVRARLQEVFGIIRDRVVTPPGAQHLYFNLDWRPVPDHDSFGHDVETAYLLVEASQVLGRRDDFETWRIARSIVDHALEYGWDSKNGGFYDAGGVFGPPSVTEKIWWVQAEAVNALLLMHTRFGGETHRYWDAFRQQWEFIERYQTDTRYGGWRAKVSREGVATPGEGKGNAWTESYHQARALLNVTQMLRESAPHSR